MRKQDRRTTVVSQKPNLRFSAVHIDMLLITNHSFFGLFALAISAAAIPATAQSQDKQAKASPPLQSPAADQGLDFSVGARGLESLSFNGQSLLRSPESGELQPSKSVFRAALDLLLFRNRSPVATPTKQADTIDLSYPWGRISCEYGKQGNALTLRIDVSNTSAQGLDELSLRLM